MTRAIGRDPGAAGESEPAPIVIKFGGTSLGTPGRIRCAARRVRRYVTRGRPVVAVVSAAGASTDRIIRWIAAVDPRARPEPREVDRALATGEDRAGAYLAAALAGEGVRALSMRGGEAGLLAEGGYCGGRIVNVDVAPLRELLARGVVPVVSGFQAARADGETLTLGRGGSDVSAVAIAAALGAPCQIVTDVDGVYDRDPRLHAGAIPFRVLDYDALLGLAGGGAQVVHPEAAERARAAAVPLRILHYRSPPSGGTRVEAHPAPSFSTVDLSGGSR